MSTSKMRPTRDRLMVGTRRRLPRRHNNAVSPRGGLEGLEDRVLLASGINTVQGISGAYLQVDAKVFNALGSDLAFLESDYNAYQTAHPGPGVPDNYQVSANQPDASILGVRNRSLVIDSVAKPGQTAVLQAQIAALGARVTGTYGAMVSAYVPLGQLAGLAGLSTLNYARASYTPVTSAGKVDDQAVGALRSDIGSAQFGTTGAGVIVGLLSDSFNNKNGYNTDVTSGDLPAGVNVLQDLGGGGTDEGRAMAQLVYDVAPGVGLAFNTAFNGQAGFATGITNLAKPAASGGAGAKVVSDDVFYYAEPMFQDGVVAQAVNNAVNAYGISYFSSAGNQSRSAYQSAFNTNTLASLPSWAPASATTTFHNFNPSGTADIYQPISIPAGTQIIIDFQWDQSYASAGGPGSTNDINLFLVNAAKTAVVASAISNNLNGDPSEVFAYNNTSSSAVTVNLAVNLKSGAAPGLMKYVLFNGTISNYATNTGASFGHNQAINAAGVGATRYDATPAYGVNPPQLEYFSSAGGSPILFDAAGNRLASPESRPQPRFTSIDGSDTTFFGGDYEGNALPNFFGTSAAAPHAAAVAALMKSAVPSLTATQIYAALQSTAIDQGAAGYDYDTGYGLIQADKALAAVTGIGISGTVFQDTNGNGIQDGSETGIAGATVFLDSNANNAIDTVTNTSIASTDVPKAIPDGTQGSPSRVTSALTVSGLTGRLTKVTVSLDIIHSYDSDLIVTLISPSGIRVPLFSSIGGPSRGGTNFTNTVLDDAAATAIQASLAPFSGTFRPQVALAALIGDDPNGTWRLEARDAWQFDSGTIQSWSIKVSASDPTTTADSSGNYAFNGLAASSYYGAYNVRQVLAGGNVQTAPASPYGFSLGIGTTAPGTNFGQAAPTNTTPTANSSSVTLPDAGQSAVALSGSDNETPASALVFTITALPTQGAIYRSDGSLVSLGSTFTGSPYGLTYRLGPATLGAISDSFQYTVTDTGQIGGGGNPLTSAAATVTIQTPAGSAGILRIEGTTGNDTIKVQPDPSNTGLQVLLNGVAVASSVTSPTVTQIRVFGNGGNDSFTLANGGALAISLFGGSGNDTFNIVGANATGAITGGGGSDALVASKNANFTLGDTQLTATDGTNVSLSGVSVANLTGGASNTVFNVGGWSGTGSIHGGSGSNTLSGPAAGSIYNINGSNAGNVNGLTFTKIGTLTGGAGNDTFMFTSAAVLSGTVNGGAGTNTLDYSAFTTQVTLNMAASTASRLTTAYSGIQNVMAGSFAGNQLLGPTSSTNYFVTGANSGNVNGLTFANFGRIVGGVGNDIFKLSDGASLSSSIEGGSGTNTIDESAYATPVSANLTTSTLTGLGSNFTNIRSITGGSAANTLTGFAASSVFNITGTNTGTVGTLTFAKFGTLIGSAGNDTFKMNGTAVITGSIDGGAGANTLDYSVFTTQVSVNLGTSTASRITNPFANIQTIIGGTNAGNVVTGPAAESTFKITAANAGNVGGINFSNFSNLAGGAGNDAFVFSNGATLAGAINGGGGVNTIDDSAYTTAVASGVSPKTITGVGTTYSNIQALIAGAAAGGTLTAGAGSAVFNITGSNAGNVAGVAFSNFGNLVGGAGSDTFKFSNGASLTGGINGGAAANTLDYGAYTAAVTINMAITTVTGIGGTYANIASILGGSSAANIVNGPNADVNWSITGVNSGFGGGLTFAKMGNISGGTGSDDFIFSNGASFSGSLDGRLGTNTLDFSAYTTAITVNMATTTVTGIGATYADIASIVGGSSSANLVIGPNAVMVWNITGIDNGNGGGLTFANMRNLTGGSGTDDFVFGDGASLGGSINGGLSTNTLDDSAYTTAVTINMATNKVTGVGGTYANLASIDGGSASGNLIIGPVASTMFLITGANFGTVGAMAFNNFGAISGGAGNDTFKFSDGATLANSINGGGGNNTIDESAYSTPITANATTAAITGVGGAFANIGSITAGTATAANTLTGFAAGSTFNITGTNTGTVAALSFAKFGSLIGGAGNDTFKFTSSAVITGSIDGGAGSNTFDYSAFTTQVSVNLATSTASRVTNPFANIQSVIGGSNTGNFIQGPAANTTYNITGANLGNVNGLSFSNFGKIVGGAADDTFVMSNGAALSGTIDGGLGSNWLDYGAYATGVAVNLATGSATGFGSAITNIRNVRGGSGNDTLTGNSQGNTLIGGAGNDTINGGSGRSLLIGGLGSDTINGGSGDDILVNGTTTLDGNFAALDSILAEWKSTTDNYATRVSLIKNGGGLNGTNTLVWGTSVIDDNAVDTLLGNAGTDWFFKGTGDTTDNQAGEQVN